MSSYPTRQAAGEQITAQNFNDFTLNPTYTYGESITAGQPLYLKASDGKAYKASAATLLHVDEFIGFAAESGSANDTKYVLSSGKVINGLSSLTAGSKYYLADTAGTISTTPGTFHFEVGIAISTTALLVNPVMTDYLQDIRNYARGTAGETISVGQPLIIEVPTSTSATLCGTGANDSSAGTTAWTNPSNITASDNTYAQIDVGQHGSLAQSQYLKASNFGFAIPSNATIQGIQMTFERHWINGGVSADVHDVVVKIVKSNGTLGSTNKASSPVAWTATTDTNDTYGGVLDLWDETWAYSDINDTDFGVVLAVSITGTTGAPATTSAKVDSVKCTITYYVDGELKKASASTTAVKGFVGIAQSAGVAGDTILFSRPGGIAKGLSGLSRGSFYYVQNTSGTLGTSAGTNSARVGVALSLTEMLVMHDVAA